MPSSYGTLRLYPGSSQFTSYVAARNSMHKEAAQPSMAIHERVEALQDAISKKAGDTVALEAKNTELEEALARALERLKAADVQAQSQQEKLAELEKARNGLISENQQLKAKVSSSPVPS